jgi:hypothetical protein
MKKNISLLLFIILLTYSVGVTVVSASSQVFTTNIVGKFNGFKQYAAFTLANGEVWIQVEYYDERSSQTNPKAVLTKIGTTGYIQVGNSGKKVRVEQLRERVDYFKTNLVGKFDGYEKDQIYPLKNGKYYLQSDTTFSLGLFNNNPEVLVYKKYGNYYLTIKDTDKFVEVTELTPGRDFYVAKLISKFPGFKPNSFIALDNGQVWKMKSVSATGGSSNSRNVYVYKKFGQFKMKVEGVSQTATVELVK